MKFPDEMRQRSRLLGRVRSHLADRAPRAVLSGIMCATAVVGFVASAAMLKLGVERMWVRYPLAVLVAWGAFLLLVRWWAESMRTAVRLDEPSGPETPDAATTTRLPKWSNPFPRGSWRLLDWVNPFEWLEAFGLEVEGCVALGAIIALIAAAVGAVFALTGLILQAETVLAEVLLDTVLVSALYHRLRSQPTDWWLGGALRRTVWPVVMTMLALTLAGALLQFSEPSAHSIGAVVRLWWNDKAR